MSIKCLSIYYYISINIDIQMNKFRVDYGYEAEVHLELYIQYRQIAECEFNIQRLQHLLPKNYNSFKKDKYTNDNVDQKMNNNSCDCRNNIHDNYTNNCVNDNEAENNTCPNGIYNPYISRMNNCVNGNCVNGNDINNTCDGNCIDRINVGREDDDRDDINIDSVGTKYRNKNGELLFNMTIEDLMNIKCSGDITPFGTCSNLQEQLTKINNRKNDQYNDYVNNNCVNGDGVNDICDYDKCDCMYCHNNCYKLKHRPIIFEPSCKNDPPLAEDIDYSGGVQKIQKRGREITDLKSRLKKYGAPKDMKNKSKEDIVDYVKKCNGSAYYQKHQNNRDMETMLSRQYKVVDDIERLSDEQRVRFATFDQYASTGEYIKEKDESEDLVVPVNDIHDMDAEGVVMLKKLGGGECPNKKEEKEFFDDDDDDDSVSNTDNNNNKSNTRTYITPADNLNQQEDAEEKAMLMKLGGGEYTIEQVAYDNSKVIENKKEEIKALKKIFI